MSSGNEFAAVAESAALPKRNGKQRALLAIVLVSFVDGAVGQFFYPGLTYAPSARWFILVYSGLIFMWFRFDSDECGYRRSPGLNIAVIAIAAIALPYYFFRSRGAKGGCVALCLALIVLLGMGVSTLAGEHAAYYLLQAPFQ